MLILFDIDGTLLLSRGAGMQCFLEAGRELFAREFRRDGMNFGGGLDPLIWRELCALNGVSEADAREQHDRFRAAYAGNLRARLAAGTLAYALPGVPELLAALAALAAPAAATDTATVTNTNTDTDTDTDTAAVRSPVRAAPVVGLLTGNYPETGELKLRAAGLSMDHFAVAAWGCDGGHRRELLPVALRRFAERTGRDVRREEVVIIGDTPHDIDCAVANGCRSLGVATGSHPVEELAACGATRAVADLSDTADLLGWLAG
ncbi:MAG TPA: HAD hydrolase-like protein [Planctomycetota bacterium]|nr:HAD hydrolase-like protein [Planctomycetota bacterium]